MVKTNQFTVTWLLSSRITLTTEALWRCNEIIKKSPCRIVLWTYAILDLVKWNETRRAGDDRGWYFSIFRQKDSQNVRMNLQIYILRTSWVDIYWGCNFLLNWMLVVLIKTPSRYHYDVTEENLPSGHLRPFPDISPYFPSRLTPHFTIHNNVSNWKLITKFLTGYLTL